MKRTETSGFTLVEVMMGAAILTVGTLGFLGVMAGTIDMDSRTNESVVAMRAAQGRLDGMWNLARRDFAQVHPTHAGAFFAVEGLVAPEGRQGVGQVIIFDNEALAKAELGLSPDLDLDRNGTANENMSKPASELRFLPVRVHVEWVTPFGVRTHDLDTIIYNRED